MRKLSLILLFLIALFFALPETAAASDVTYDITRYTVHVDILEDGSAVFQHAITYNFDSEFNGFLYTLDYAGYETPEDISVWVVDENGSESAPFIRDDTDTSTGNYSIVDQGSSLDFRVNQPGSDEEKTVVYRYQIPEIVVNYQDVAEFNHKVIGENWEDPIENIEITIQLPEPVSNNELRAWGHGALTGTVALEGNQTVKLTVDENPSNQFVESRVIFPADVTASNPNQVDELALDRIIAQEQQLEDDMNARSRMMIWIAVILTILSAVVTLAGFIWTRKLANRKDKAIADVPEYLYELPSDITPAVMFSALNNQLPRSVDLTATIMDLARKKQIKLSEIESTGGEPDYVIRKTEHPEKRSLLTHEHFLLEWFINKIGNGNEVTLEEIEAFGLDDEQKAETFNDSYDKWKHYVREAASDLEYISKKHKTVIFISIAMAVLQLLLLGSLVSVMIVNSAFYLWALLIAGGGFLFSLFHWIPLLPVYTDTGLKAAVEWDAFKAMLVNISDVKMADAGSLSIWEHYLVYAISLGVADKVTQEMDIQYKDEDTHSSYSEYHYYGYNWVMFGNFHSRFDRSFNDAVSNSSVAVSGDSGSGGSFSGGSSGGGGGGSGGGAF